MACNGCHLNERFMGSLRYAKHTMVANARVVKAFSSSTICRRQHGVGSGAQRLHRTAIFIADRLSVSAD